MVTILQRMSFSDEVCNAKSFPVPLLLQSGKICKSDIQLDKYLAQSLCEIPVVYSLMIAKYDELNMVVVKQEASHWSYRHRYISLLSRCSCALVQTPLL